MPVKSGLDIDRWIPKTRCARISVLNLKRGRVRETRFCASLSLRALVSFGPGGHPNPSLPPPPASVRYMTCVGAEGRGKGGGQFEGSGNRSE